MGFFGTSAGYSAGSSNIEDLLNDDSLDIKENLNIMEAAYEYVAESEMNWNAIMEAAAMSELEYFNSTGKEYDTLSEAGFLENIVNFFKKIWEKIKALFKKFLVMLGSLVQKDTEFAKTHEKTITAAISNIPDDAKIKGYVFTYEKLKSSIDTAGAGLNTTLGSISKDASGSISVDIGGILDGGVDQLTSDNYDSAEINEKIRGKIMSGIQGATASMTDSEMRECAYSCCRNGEDTANDITISGSVVSKALSDLKGGNKAKKDAAELYSKTEKVFKGAMKAAEKIQSNFYKETKAGNSDADKTAYNNNSNKISRALTHSKAVANMIQTLCSVYLQAVKDKYAQDRKICVKVITYKTPKNESAYFGSSGNGYFRSVNMI